MTEDIKVRAQNMNGAIHEDSVELHLINNFSSKIEGRITKVIERKLSEFTGTIEDNKDFAFFIPNNKKIYSDFFIKKRNSEKFSNKKKYLAKITSWTGGKKPFAKVLDQLVILEVMKPKYIQLCMILIYHINFLKR